MKHKCNHEWKQISSIEDEEGEYVLEQYYCSKCLAKCTVQDVYNSTREIVRIRFIKKQLLGGQVLHL